MKKDIEWLKNEFDEVIEFRKQSNPNSSWGMGSNNVLKYIKEDFKNLIDQLDEPETLFIDKEQLIKRIENYIPLHDKTVGDVVDGILEIVKQLPEMEVLSPEWIDENQHPYGGDYHVPSEKLEELLVPKQELPVIPKFVAEWISAQRDIGYTLQQLFYQVHWAYKDNDMDKEQEWVSSNGELFARAWLDGFTVKKEKKYYVVKSEGLDGVHHYFTTFDDEMNGLFTLPNDKKGAYKFDDKEKAQDIANYTDSEVEELEE